MSYAEQLHQHQEFELMAALAQADAIGIYNATAPGDTPEEDEQLELDRLDMALRELGIKDGLAAVDTTAPAWEDLRAFALE